MKVLPSETFFQSLNLADFTLFRRGTSIVRSVVGPAQVYHTERPPLFAAGWP